MTKILHQSIALLFTIWAAGSGTAQSSSHIKPLTLPAPFSTIVSGNLSTLAEIDRYTFTGTAGQRIMFDAIDLSNTGINISLAPPSGSPNFTALFSVHGDYGPIYLTESGVYTITVAGSGGAFGNYKFRIVDLASATPVTIGQTFFGQINPSTQAAFYSIGGLAGHKIKIDGLNMTGIGGVYRLYDPDNQLKVGNTVIDGGGTTYQFPTTGTYILAVDGSIESSNSISFQIKVSDVSDATVAQAGIGFEVVHSGTLAADQTNTFTFTAPQGLPIFWDSLLAQGSSAVSYQITDPETNAITFGNGGASYDQGPIVLPKAGKYTVTLTGTGDYNFRILNMSTSAVPLTVGTTYNPALTPGFRTLLYQFTNAPGSRVFVDFLNTNPVVASARMYGPEGIVSIFQVPMSIVDNGPYFLFEPGVYYFVLESGAADPITELPFRILDLNRPGNVTDIGFNTTINGTLNPVTRADVYRFNTTAGQRLFFDGLSTNVYAQWILYGPDNLSKGGGNLTSDFELPAPQTGTHVLVVYGQQVVDPIQYSFRIVTAAQTNIALTLGAVTSGNLTTSGEEHRYVFNGTAGQRIYYDAIDADSDNINVRLYGPSNKRDNPIYIYGNSDTDGYVPYSLTESGTYTLIVGGMSDTIGDYKFRLLDVAQAPVKDIAADTTVNGTLTIGTQTDLYRFQGTANQRIFVDGLSTNTSMSYILYNPLNVTISSFVNAASDIELTLQDTGTYVLAITSTLTNSLNYAIRIRTTTNVVQALQLGVVTKGTLAGPGDEHDYTFSATAGQRILFDGQGTNYTVSVHIEDSARTPLGLTTTTAPGDSTVVTIPESGIYRVVLHRDTDAPADYSFRVLDLAAQPLTALGQTVTGQLNPGSKTELIRFTATSGQRVTVTNLLAGSGDIYFNLLGPANQSLANGVESSFADSVLLPDTGTYALIVYKTDPFAAASNYQIQLRDASGTAVAPVGFGQVRSGTVAAGATNSTTFAGTAGTRIYFDSLTNASPLNVLIIGPTGDQLYFNNAGVDYGPIMLPKNGTYTVSVYSPDPTATGNYIFRIINVDSAPAVAPGQLVASTIQTPYGAEFYRITNVASGQRIFYDALTNTTAGLYLDLFNPSGGRMVVGNFGSLFPGYADFGPVTAIDPGTYYLAMYNTVETNADYRFRYIDAAVAPASVLPFNTVVNGTLDPGDSIRVFRFDGLAGQQYFFNSSGTNASGNWYLYGPNFSGYGGNNLTGDFETTLTASGIHTLVLLGSGTEPVQYSFTAVIPTAATNSIQLDTVVSGALAKPGDEQVFTFNATYGQRLYLDSLMTETPLIEFKIIPPGGIQLNGGYLYSDLGPFMILESGVHTIRLHNHTDGSVPFSFRLLDVDTKPFVALDTLQTGDLSGGVQAHIFRFTAVPDQRLVFHSTGTNTGSSWYIYDAMNAGYGAANLAGDLDITPLRPGAYALVISATVTNSGTYAFTIIPGNHAPIIPVIQPQNVNEESAFSFQVQATDPEQPNDKLIYSLGPLVPAGLTINSGTGVISWTPTEAQGPSTNTITVNVTDDGVPNITTSRTFTLMVNESNRPPVLAAIADRTINELTALTVTNSATDPDLPANALTYSLVNPPAGMVIDPNTGVLTWTPTEAQGPSTNLITVRVTDNSPFAINEKQLSDTKTFTVIVREVNTAPVLTAPTSQTIAELSTLTINLTTVDSDLPVNTLTYALVSGPTGVAVDAATGKLTWTPTEVQGPSTNTITFQVTDNSPDAVNTKQLSDTKSITVVVTEVNAAPALTVPAGPLIVNELSTLTVTNTATDSDVPANSLTFALASGPTGVSVNATTGVLTWTPTEAQGPSTNTISVKVTDNGTPSLSVTQSFVVIVKEVNVAPVLAQPSNTSIDELTTLTVNLSATDADSPANPLTYSLVTGPSSATVNATTGVLTWTPGEAVGPGSVSFTVKVTDNSPDAVNQQQMSDTKSFTVTVNEVNQAPTLDAPAPVSIDELSTLTVTNFAGDRDLPTNSLAFSLVNPPAGALINPSTGILTWTPTEAQGPGNYNITVRVTDNGTPPLSTDQVLQVTVREVNQAPVLAAIADKTASAGALLTFSATATDADLPANTLTYSLDTGAPAGASISSTTGAFTWTPTTAQASSTNRITVRVTDNGSPALSDSKSFNVVVGAIGSAPPHLVGLLLANGQFKITSTATPGKTHVVQGTADLKTWSDLLTTNVVGASFEFTDTATASKKIQYYRVIQR